MGTTVTPIFYKDRPLFGLDVGTHCLKIMQTNQDGNKKPSVVGYGMAFFDQAAIKDGIIVDYKAIAKTVNKLINNNLVGEISTHRVALSVPASKTYTREMILPKMSSKELSLAVRTEAERYIPRSLDDLSLDYTINHETADGLSVYTIAAPKKITDSYVRLAEVLGLEPVLIEPTIGASTRLLQHDTNSQNLPSVFLDFGASSADISIYDKFITVTGTVPCGGDLFTKHICEALGLSESEATLIKTKYGIGASKKQSQIIEAVTPLLEKTIYEIRRMIRYYEERGSNKNKIGQVISTGGGANMPGLSDYLTSTLRLPTRMFDPWQTFDFGKLQPPSYSERSVYMTVAGLAMANPKEIFK